MIASGVVVGEGGASSPALKLRLGPEEETPPAPEPNWSDRTVRARRVSRSCERRVSPRRDHAAAVAARNCSASCPVWTVTLELPGIEGIVATRLGSVGTTVCSAHEASMEMSSPVVANVARDGCIGVPHLRVGLPRGGARSRFLADMAEVDSHRRARALVRSTGASYGSPGPTLERVRANATVTRSRAVQSIGIVLASGNVSCAEVHASLLR